MAGEDPNRSDNGERAESAISALLDRSAPVLAVMFDAANAIQWLDILAIPRIYRSMTRVPPREHLLHMVDIVIDYVTRGEKYVTPEFEPVPYEERLPRARELRALLEAWEPPELPPEITEAARALLYAEGLKGGAEGWDAMPDPDMRPEEYLLWPEGVPALLKAKAGECICGSKEKTPPTGDASRPAADPPEGSAAPDETTPVARR